MLFSLCVADDGGLCLLLPAPPPELERAARQPGDSPNASRAPARGNTAPVRVEMVATTLNRVGAARKSPVVNHAHAPWASLFPLPESSSPRYTYAPPARETASPVPRPKDRAPPSLA